MNKKSLLAIERIISCINELDILTKNKDADYFYKSFEMNMVLDLIYEIENSLNKISDNIKLKYDNVDWQVVEKAHYYDEVMGSSLKINKAWELANKIIKDKLLNNLNIILEKEIPEYYKNLCNKRHKKFIRDKQKKN